MKNPNPKSECVLITHIVNPHQFYYKHIDRIANGTFSKFDFEIQLYGNELHAQNTHGKGYVPVENELVIFFNVIFNKWIRGRVIGVGPEMTFWCIDNGIWEKLTAPHVLPLPEQFHKDMNLVRLGGLSLLPTEKTWNVQTEEVENQLSEKWDEKSRNLFKGIISKSKTFTFTEEFEVGNHSFGLLAVESKTANRKEINQILLEMNSAAPSSRYSDDDLWSYVHDARIKTQLCESILDNSSLRVANLNNNVAPTKPVQRAFLKYGSEVSSVENLNLPPNEYFDDTASRQSSDISTMMESEAVPDETIRKSEAPSGDDAKPTISQIQNDRPKGEFHKNLTQPSSLDTSETASALDSQEKRDQIYINARCYLRTCRRIETPNIRQQPLRSTMDWIDSMSKLRLSNTPSKSDKSCASSSTISSNENSSINQTSPSSATKSRRNMLAAFSKKEPEVDATVTNSENVANRRFGIPAGYAKNCLGTFGGMNRR